MPSQTPECTFTDLYTRLMTPATQYHSICEWEWDWLRNVICNEISVIAAHTCRCAGGLKKKLDVRSGSQRHRHFVGFFNVRARPSTDTGQIFLYGYSEKLSHFVAVYDTLGIRRTHSRLNPRVPTGDSICTLILISVMGEWISWGTNQSPESQSQKRQNDTWPVLDYFAVSWSMSVSPSILLYGP